MPEDVMPLTAALVALAEAAIPTDVQGLLVQGDPTRGIPPGALLKALAAGHHPPSCPPPTAEAGREAEGQPDKVWHDAWVFFLFQGEDDATARRYADYVRGAAHA